jgi:hypothetical protein
LLLRLARAQSTAFIIAFASGVEGGGAASFGAILIVFLLCSRWWLLLWVAGGGAGGVMAADAVQQRGSRARVAQGGYAGASRWLLALFQLDMRPLTAYLA